MWWTMFSNFFSITNFAGVALTGDPDYRIVMEAYPFVTRKIISDDSPALQRALRDILYRYFFVFSPQLLYIIS